MVRSLFVALTVALSAAQAYADAPWSMRVRWINSTNVADALGALEKTTSDGWNGGARSYEAISIVENGWVEFTATETDKGRICGLGHVSEPKGYDDVQFGIVLRNDGLVAIREGGVLRGVFGPYHTGDVFRVAVEDDVVTYSKNGTVFYTSTQKADTYPLAAVASLNHKGATLSNVTLAETPRLAVHIPCSPVRDLTPQEAAVGKLYEEWYVPAPEVLHWAPLKAGDIRRPRTSEDDIRYGVSNSGTFDDKSLQGVACSYDLVVEGEVRNMESLLTPAKTFVYMKYDIEVFEVIKHKSGVAAPPLHSIVVMTQPGGTVCVEGGSASASIVHEIPLLKDGRFVFLLSKSESGTYIGNAILLDSIGQQVHFMNQGIGRPASAYYSTQTPDSLLAHLRAAICE